MTELQNLRKDMDKLIIEYDEAHKAYINLINKIKMVNTPEEGVIIYKKLGKAIYKEYCAASALEQWAVYFKISETFITK